MTDALMGAIRRTITTPAKLSQRISMQPGMTPKPGRGGMFTLWIIGHQLGKDVSCTKGKSLEDLMRLVTGAWVQV